MSKVRQRMKLAVENSTKKEDLVSEVNGENVVTPLTSQKDLDKLMNDINKKFGANAVVLGASIVEETIKRIPTGSIALDIALGGGIPVGRFTQISGALSSTKTTQSLHIIKNAQKMGYICAILDVEGTITEDYMIQVGIDPSKILYTRPSGLEECTEMILQYQKSGLVHLALWDSIEASSPTKEQDTTMEETVQMGVKQKLNAEFCRKYQANNNKLSREGKIPFTLLGINQLREKIGAYGDAEYTPGGRALGFTATVDLRLRRGDWLAEGSGDNKEFVGQVVKFKIEKNKTYKRMQTGEFDFYFAENNVGIEVGHVDNFKSIVIESIAWGLIERGGAWYTLDKENNIKFQGTEKLIEYLRENPEIVDKLKEQILELAKNTK